MEPDKKTEILSPRGRKKLPPGVAKVRRTIAIDAKIWDRALEAFPSVSAVVEDSLRKALKKAGK